MTHTLIKNDQVHKGPFLSVFGINFRVSLTTARIPHWWPESGRHFLLQGQTGRKLVGGFTVTRHNLVLLPILWWFLRFFVSVEYPQGDCPQLWGSQWLEPPTTGTSLNQYYEGRR